MKSSQVIIEAIFDKDIQHYDEDAFLELNELLNTALIKVTQQSINKPAKQWEFGTGCSATSDFLKSDEIQIEKALLNLKLSIPGFGKLVVKKS